MAASKVRSTYNGTGGALRFNDLSGNELLTIDGPNRAVRLPAVAAAAGLLYNIRKRFTIAQVNAGATILAAPGTGYKYRMVGCRAISVGGAAAAVTTVDILSTQTTSVKLVAYAQASLTQSTVLTAGGSGAAVLADGASFVANDANAAVTINITGSAVTTATHIDVDMDYVIELI